MKTIDKCKVMKVYWQGMHIATIDAYEGSVSVSVEHLARELADQSWALVGLWYGDIAGSAQTMTKAEILELCRDEIEQEVFPNLEGITYGRPKVCDIYKFYSL